MDLSEKFYYTSFLKMLECTEALNTFGMNLE